MSQTKAQLLDPVDLTIVTDDIANGAINNAKVNASAAIDVSKLSGVMPLAGGIFTGDVTFDGATAGRDIVFDRSDNALEFADNAKAIFGAGNDLQIYHDGTSNIITSVNGNFFLQASSGENGVTINKNGGIDLYHDNSKKFETISTGANVTSANDAVLKVTTTGSASTDDARIELITQESSFIIQNDRSLGTDGALNIGDGTDTYLQATKDAEIALYYNNSKKLETFSGGVLVTGSVNADQLHLGDSDKALFGNSNDLQIYHNGSNSYIDDSGTGSLIARTNQFLARNISNDENMIVATANGSVDLYYDNSKKFETTSTGVTVPGLLNIPDGGANGNRIALGTGNDLRIYHDSSNSVIDNQTGYLVVQSSGSGQALYLQGAVVQAQPAGGGEIYFEGNQNGAFEAYYDNSKKFETISTGVTVTGDVNITDDLVINSSNAQQVLRDFTSSSDSDISGLLSGSTFGTLLEAAPNGHHVIALRDNDTSDSFAIVSGGGNHQSDDTYDTLVARFFSNGVLQMPDNNSIKLGTSNDLQLFHDGSNSYVKNAGSGALILEGASHVHIKHGGEEMIRAQADGAVELYFDNSKKFQTNSGGADVTGDFGISGEFNMTADGNKNRFIDCSLDDGEALFIRSTQGGDANHENMALFVRNQQCELYFDNSKKLETLSNGIKVTNFLGVGVQAGNSLGNRTYGIAIGDNDTGFAQNGDGTLEVWANNQVELTFDAGGNGGRAMFNHSDTGSYNANVSCRENSSGPFPFGAIGQTTNQGLIGFFDGVGNLIGSIGKSGSSTTYNTTSDYRLKENDVAISDGITRIKQLRPIRFNWKEFPEKGNEDGFFAHEVSSVVPEAVTGDKDAIITQEYINAGKELQSHLNNPLLQSLDHSKLVPLIVAAVKELITKVETLEAA